MIIHVVQPDETLKSISDYYKIPVDRLILENGITNPANLAIGQTIVIANLKHSTPSRPAILWRVLQCSMVLHQWKY